MNLQVGVYMGSIAGFSSAKIQMERQVVFTPEWHSKLVVLKDCFPVGQRIEISYELMHQIFVKIKQGCAKLIFNWLGVDTGGRFDIDQLAGFAIQKGRNSRG